METIKVSEATERQLDWLAARIEGLELHCNALLDGQIKQGWWVSGYYMDPNNWVPLSLLNYSTDWARGGPIIEREGINLGTQRNEPGFKPHIDYLWHAQLDQRVYVGYGPTPLIAAMRCYVASKLGETVEVPEDLV